ncbi:MAG: glycosyltransferase family 39 protein, partial [Candidatus Margulisbacteria bacterium]|nr:glycosyltransferase family 39 protein [Candidatus Margulisiibacteriota bacterium]
VASHLSQGEELYRDLVDNKPPVIFYVYSLIFKCFGESEAALRLFTAFFSLLTTFFIFLIGKELSDERLGVVSALLYAIFSGGMFVEGTGSNTEIFMALPLVLGLYCYLREKPFLAGLFSGLAVMIKPVALFNYLVLLAGGRAKWVKLVSGFLIVPLAFMVYFWLKGALAGFINCNLYYSLGMVNPNIVYFLIRTGYVFLFENSVLWILAGLGAILIMVKLKEPRSRILLWWTVFSLFGVFSAGYAFGHYYIQAMPGLCLLGGIAVVRWKEFGFSKPITMSLWAIIAAFALFIIANQYPFYLFYNGDQISVERYGTPANVMARDIGLKIKARTKPDDRIFTKSLYSAMFYSGRDSLSRYYLTVRGGSGEVYFLGKKMYSHGFGIRRSAELLQAIETDFNLALADIRTKYFIIYLKDYYAPPDLARKLVSYGYQPDRELSYPKEGVLVFKRSKQ